MKYTAFYKYISTISILLLCISVQAQTVISGRVLDEMQKTIPNVSVSYKKPSEAAISGFGKTDNQGRFRLEIKVHDVDSVQLDFNHLGYAKYSVTVANTTASYAYVLQKQIREIKEVKLADVPIYRRKDTVNYIVDSFTSKEDRVIGDIIRKLPGIEMQGDEIFYQGKPIQKYMVNNLDLMGGRYSMINKNLPADAVKKVQIVENDQPIKILDSLVFSNRASLNLDLKKFTSTGTGKVAAGMSPALWDINLTPITFGKTFQMLNSFQTNNTGYDAAGDLRPFYTESGGYFWNDENVKDGPAYIHLRNVSSPGFDQRKWLDNKIFLFSTNMLQKLNSGLELKGNVSYYDDSRQRQGFLTTQYFTTDEIIYSSEAIDNRYRINVLDAGVFLEKNEKQIYFRNSLKYHKRWNRDRGDLLLDESALIGQRIHYTDEALFNSLSMARFIGKQLVNISSTLEWHRTPQRLSVSPGQFEDILTDGQVYEQMAQNVLYDGMRWENNIGFTRRIKRWTVYPSVELNYNRSDLDTHITLEKEGKTQSMGDGYLNDMRNSQLHIRAGLRIGWENPFWKLHLTIPYSVYYFNVMQQDIKTMDNALKKTFNPSASLVYLKDAKNEISVRFSGGRQYGGLDNFYNGYIIGHYRSMQRYDARLLGTDSKSARLGYNYKNTLRANFANMSYTYTQDKREYMFTTQIDALGRTTTSIADQYSQNNRHNLSAGLSRFFLSFKTVVKLHGNLGWSRSDYLLNDALSVQHITGRSATVEVINSLSNVISGDYKMALGQTESKFAAVRHNKVFYNNHYLNIMLYPHHRHAVTLSNSLYRNNIPGQKNQFFMDATYSYRLVKWKTDLEFTAQNLFDNSRFVQQISNNIELVQSYFELRPRQFLFSTRFKF